MLALSPHLSHRWLFANHLHGLRGPSTDNFSWKICRSYWKGLHRQLIYMIKWIQVLSLSILHIFSVQVNFYWKVCFYLCKGFESLLKKVNLMNNQLEMKTFMEKPPKKPSLFSLCGPQAEWRKVCHQVIISWGDCAVHFYNYLRHC